MPTPPADIKPHIVLIRLRLLGDIIFTIPAIQLLKKQFPTCALTYVVEESFAEIAALIPGIDRIMTVPRHMSLRELYAFRRQLRATGVHAVVDFHSGPKSALLTRLTGAALRIGYRTPNRNWAYTHKMARAIAGQIRHSVISQCALLEPLGIHAPIPPAYPDLSIARPIAMGKEDKKSIVIHVGAGNKFRDWGLDRFASLIAACTDNGLFVTLIGNSSAEMERASFLASRQTIDNQAGKLSLRQTIERIATAAVYVGADSGPLHIASLTSTPIVALFGPNIPEISGPWRSQSVTILQTALPCRPCSQHACKYDTIQCMQTISVEAVYEAIGRYL